jgi:RNA polymerase sigma factor (sigma-70 family)
MTDAPDPLDFERTVLPHLAGAYSLARLLMHGAPEAEDVVQEAILRALTYFHTFNRTNARAWMLQIVRNTAYDALRRQRDANLMLRLDAGLSPFDSGRDEELKVAPTLADPSTDPEAHLAQAQEHELLESLLEELPVMLRASIVLHELHELSYKEVAEITNAPIGTVMSRLWRARRALIKRVRERELEPS